MPKTRIAELEARVAALEGAVKPCEARPRRARGPADVRPPRFERPAPVVPATPPAARRAGARGRRPGPRRATRAARRSPKRDLEDFLGGSVLAWLGGVAVLAGLAFLLTIAVSRGWIGEGARTAMAGVLSLGLLGIGVWLREQRGEL